MEEKKKRIGFPLWIEAVKIAVIMGVILYTGHLYYNGFLQNIGLLIAMAAIWVVSECYRLFEESEIEEAYEDEIDELKSQINCLDQENVELRKVVKGYTEPKKESVKKTKKQ